jgi:hypothetical protein
MEDILDVYHGTYDARHPLVCMDESNKQLLGEVREPMPMTAETPGRYDAEYERHGTGNLFLAFAPLPGWRTVQVTEHRAKPDGAYFIKDVVDVHFPDAELITLVVDNLNRHDIASLYATFEPAEARRLARKLEIHYPPKHGSWLNMAEIEFSILSRQCLKRRISDRETLQHEVSAWTDPRNTLGARVDWRFTTDNARIKLKRLYPKV